MAAWLKLCCRPLFPDGEGAPSSRPSALMSGVKSPSSGTSRTPCCDRQINEKGRPTGRPWNFVLWINSGSALAQEGEPANTRQQQWQSGRQWNWRQRQRQNIHVNLRGCQQDGAIGIKN